MPTPSHRITQVVRWITLLALFLVLSPVGQVSFSAEAAPGDRDARSPAQRDDAPQEPQRAKLSALRHVFLPLMAHSVGELQGTVRNAVTDAPLPGITVTVYGLEGSEPAPSRYAITDNTGAYRLGNLNNRYRVQFTDPAGEYLPLTYPREIVVTSGVTSGIDAALLPGSHLSGRVTEEATGAPLSDTTVVAWLDRGAYWENVSGARTASDGTYELSGLAEGTYRVSFQHPDYGYEFFDNVGYLEEAANIILSVGQRATNIDAQLVAGGKISGTVLEARTQKPSPFNVPVVAWRLDADAGAWRAFSSTSADIQTGSYTFTSLPVGTYRVKFDGGAIYVTEFYDNVTDFAAAQDILVTASNTVTGIDALLEELR